MAEYRLLFASFLVFLSSMRGVTVAELEEMGLLTRQWAGLNIQLLPTRGATSGCYAAFGTYLDYDTCSDGCDRYAIFH